MAFTQAKVREKRIDEKKTINTKVVQDSDGWIASGNGYTTLTGKRKDGAPIQEKNSICGIPQDEVSKGRVTHGPALFPSFGNHQVGGQLTLRISR